MDLVKYPKGYCPKCGMGEAFSADPSYRSTVNGEYLEWYCSYCNFSVKTPVLNKTNSPIIEEDEPF